MKIHLFLVDDHEVVRTGLKMLLSNEEDVVIVGEAGTAREAIDGVGKTKPDVILMDIGLPDISGIEATQKIKSQYPDMAIVALTIHEDEEYFFRMLGAGASGYIPKRAAPEDGCWKQSFWPRRDSFPPDPIGFVQSSHPQKG
jgi:DNA-binding NarL/FixJ family response regulator